MANKIIVDENKIKELLSRGVEDIIVREHLENQLKSGKQLRIKFGIDPTAPDIHLGHTVPLRKLKQFQDLGHKIIILIGNFTAQIGDPSGRSQARKILSKEEVDKNEENYLSQAEKILDLEKAEIIHNDEWFSKGGAKMIFELAAAGSIQQVLHRADFKKRLQEDQDITLLETLYPLFQGYDSVMVRADVEIGGTDQLFNLLMGRRVQKFYGIPEQDIITTPILEGLDGIKKMSKSLGNYIGVAEESSSMLGKIMSVPDDLIIKYFLLCTDIPEADIKSMENDMQSGKLNPRDAKLNLAFEIVKIYHGEKKAQKAKEEFINIFSKKELPTNIEEFKLKNAKINIVDLLLSCEAVKSKGEAKRLVEQKGIKINDKVIEGWDGKIEFKGGEIIHIGKRKFLKIVL